jgi:hypothetical protein
MPDDVYEVEFVVKLEKTLENFISAAREGKTFDSVMDHIRKRLAELGTGSETKFIATSFISASHAAQEFRKNVEGLKTLFSELRASSGLAFKDAAEGVRQVVKEIQDAKTLELAEAGGKGKAAPLFSTKEISTSLKEIETEAKVVEKEFRAIGETVKTSLTPAEKSAQAISTRFRDLIVSAKGVKETLPDAFGKGIHAANILAVDIQRAVQFMRELGAAGKLSTQGVVQSFQGLNAQTKQFSQGAANAAIKQYVSSTQQATQATTGWIGSIQRLGTVGQAVFGTIFGVTVVGVIRQIVSGMGDLIKRGLDLNRSFFNLSVAVRALQRVGLDISFEEVNTAIAALQARFGIFTRGELVEGTSQLLLLTRNLRLSKEETFALIDATAQLAIITQKDFGETGFLIARAVASGYTEALQRAGIEASRTAIEQAALARGIDKAFLAMTQAERAAVTLDLILKQLGATSTDLDQFQGSLAGRALVADVAFKQTADTLGTLLLPIMVKFKEFIAKALIPTIVGVTSAFIFLLSSAIAYGIGFAAATKAALDGQIISYLELAKAIVQARDELISASQETLTSGFTLPFEGLDVAVGIPGIPLDDEAAEKQQKIADDIREIFRKFQEDLLDASINLQRQLDDIETKRLQNVADEELEWAQKIEEINRSTEDKIAEATENFHLKELEAEEKFQEQLTKLREGFLLDLEDALRERDALQVLRLIRRFNLAQTQLSREAALEAEQRQRAFEDELADIQEQRAIRLRELQIEHEQRLAEIELQAQRERDAAQLDYARKLEDLQRHMNDRLAILKAGLEAELALHAAAGQALIAQAVSLADILRQVYGSIFGDSSANLDAGGGGGGKPAIPPLKFQHGGTLVARKPTLALFGEVPEVVQFSPIGRIGRNEDRVFGGGLPFDRPRHDRGRMDIRIDLSRDLVGRIIDNALDDLANVIIQQVG